MPQPRINKCIELLEQCQCLYYANVAELTYQNGKAQARTWTDFLMVDFEHDPFNVEGLRAFARGLVDGGPTTSGHRTPGVIVTLPSSVRTADEVNATS